MNTQAEETSNELSRLAEEARALVSATGNVAGHEIAEARKRLAAALERSKEFCGRVRDQAVEGAKAADKAVHEHPYPAMAVALGAGALIGYLIASRCACRRD
ncbi:MAG TPA: hypothetical protein DCM86_07175 [Verrucomicrobiales bacterium]|nr:hypothetical protein [Verrucomicrobiales bacterium]